LKEKKNIKVIWPNDKETFVSDGDDWFSSAEKAGLDIPTGCLTGSCGACEIDVNGETVRACISEIKNYKESTLRVSLTTDPFWEK
jgi:succinate dehydrogenase/fumarate reductase-like Fe-S protein